MSRTSRARELSSLTKLSHQQAVQHLARLALGPLDEKKYLTSFRNDGVLHRLTCVCGASFFSCAPLVSSCPRCSNQGASPTATASVAIPTPNDWMKQNDLKPGKLARPWRIFSPKRLPPGRKLSESGHSSHLAWEECFSGASWFDHGEVWIKGGRAVCVTGQPYVLDERASASLERLKELGAVIRVHPRDARRSWHNPGNCYLVEVWRSSELEGPPPTRRPRPSGKATMLARKPAANPKLAPVHAVLTTSGRPTAKSPFGLGRIYTVCNTLVFRSAVEYVSFTDDEAVVTCSGCKGVLDSEGFDPGHGSGMCADCERYPSEGHLPNCRFVTLYGKSPGARR